MKEQLLSIKLPDKYEKGLIEYVPGLDNEPQWPELQKLGYTLEKYMKLQKLVSIEAMNYALDDAKEDGEATDTEVAEIENLIKNAIEEYNNM